ncbi:hypothetical protein V6N13_139885 [Hibiscus sabdariffa]|uniref:PHD-type domain-containing protein n=1 Tax=Hibiscus sabdariffa TaxID=183260 RepID=A0ABR2AI70_9ROSI
MGYNLRDRKLLNSRGTYFGSSGSDDESYDSDPDFGTPARRPRTRRSMPRAAGIRIPGSGGENSSGNLTGNMERMWSGLHPRTSEHRRRLIEINRRRKRTFSRVPDVAITKRTVLSWLISMGVVSENEEVWYLDAPWGNILGEGKVTREGIVCMCCSRLVTVGEFEAHAGWKTNKPYQHIVLAESLLSLFDCQIEAWEEKEEEERRKFNHIQPAPKAVDTSDDACMICADGGDLICCDTCPSTFHPKCIFMENLPQGDWLCFYCVCKYCGTARGILNKCSQCDKLYHCKCGGEKLDLMNRASTLFCGKTCKKIYERLERMVGVRNDLEDGLSWTHFQRRGQPWTASCENDEYTRVECNSKIAVAWQVMNECFLSTMDRHTRANIVQSIVYNCGSNFTRINYSGFYTAVLEKGDEMISAASIRVHGKMLAEMPFIGTRGRYRRQGMARVLQNCIESIETLVIPAMDQLTGMWIDKYFFARVEDENLKQALSGYNVVMFPADVVKLHKTLSMRPDLNQAPPEDNED